MYSYAKWFKCTVLVGVLINIAGMALPFILAPQWYLDFFGLPGGGGSAIWMRQAGLLLFYVSLLYMPGGLDPERYRLNAFFAVVGRMTIGLYWMYLVFIEGQTRSYLKFGYFDVGYAALTAILFWCVVRASHGAAKEPRLVERGMAGAPR